MLELHLLLLLLQLLSVRSPRQLLWMLGSSMHHLVKSRNHGPLLLILLHAAHSLLLSAHMMLLPHNRLLLTHHHVMLLLHHLLLLLLLRQLLLLLCQLLLLFRCHHLLLTRQVVGRGLW
jgi:hypothetical protein